MWLFWFLKNPIKSFWFYLPPRCIVTWYIWLYLSSVCMFSTCRLSLFFFFGTCFVSADKFIERHGSIHVLTMNNRRQFTNCFKGRAGMNPRVHGRAYKPMQMKGIRALYRALYIFVSRQTITMETTGSCMHEASDLNPNEHLWTTSQTVLLQADETFMHCPCVYIILCSSFVFLTAHANRHFSCAPPACQVGKMNTGRFWTY